MSVVSFYLMAAGACLFALLTVLSRNIFHSALWLSMALLGVAGIYFFLDANFLGVIQVLVYIGGIITLFVFAIKLTANIESKSVRQINEQVFAAGVCVVILFVFLFKAIRTAPWKGLLPQAKILSLPEIGKALLTEYVLPFEFISLILLAAMIGAIVIGKEKK